MLFFEDKEGSVLGRLISGDHKIGWIRSPAAKNGRNNAEVSRLSFLSAYVVGVFSGMRMHVGLRNNIKEFKKTTVATATGTSLNERF